MKTRIHADDFGISRPTTDAILECHDQGPLIGTSVMTNGADLDYAMREAAKRPKLELAIHLTLTTGYPVSEPKQIQLLVDHEGRFRHSFLSLWLIYLWGNSSTRNQLKEQIRREWQGQIARFVGYVGTHQKIKVDSHHHVHTLPFVFEILLELAEPFQISHIRVPREVFFISLSEKSSFCRYLGANLVKHLLLRWLTRNHSSILDSLNIQYNTWFIGVLFTGNMSLRSVQRALSVLKGSEEDLVEILFHPGHGVREKTELLKCDTGSLLYGFRSIN